MRTQRPVVINWMSIMSRLHRPASFPAVAIVLFGLLALPPALPAAVQVGPEASGPQELHPEATEAISRIRSPWCPGLMLEVCPSPEAAAFRDTLQAMAGRGIEADSLVEWALGLYGEEWRAVPQTRGTGLLAWIVPPLALLVGIAVVVLVLRKIRVAPDERADGANARTLTEQDERMLEEALREMDGPDL